MRSQDRLGACTAFSLAAAVDHALLRVNSRDSVSAVHAWSRYHAPFMDRAVAQNLGRPLTAESAWLYNVDSERSACSWVSCDDPSFDSCRTIGPACSTTVDAARVAAADAHPIASIAHVVRLFDGAPGTANDAIITSLQRTLAKGQDVWFAMSLNADDFETTALLRQHDGLPFVVPNFGRAQAESSHAILLAGYAVRPTGRYFLIHNSWGRPWGDGGYAWIHEITLRDNLQAAYVVDARPAMTDAPPIVAQQMNQCPVPQMADSATGACALFCPDGSPRFSGACPVATHCASGFVNLSGQCVVAAPTETGVDRTSRIGFRCAPGGCAFSIPSGSSGCTKAWCSVSCAAPRYKLAFGSTGHTCVP